MVIIGGIFGIALSLFADAVGRKVGDWSEDGYLLLSCLLFVFSSYLLIRFFTKRSQEAARHWHLLEALLQEADKSKSQ